MLWFVFFCVKENLCEPIVNLLYQIISKMKLQKSQNLADHTISKVLIVDGFPSGDLAGARTQDPLLKREMLYQLSYQVLRAMRLQIYSHLLYYSKRF